MSQADKGSAEPSMEEILASIRRIISDDKEEDVPADSAPAEVAAAPSAQPAPVSGPAPAAPPGFAAPIQAGPAAMDDAASSVPVSAPVMADAPPPKPAAAQASVAAPPPNTQEIPVVDTPPQEGAEEMELTEILEEEPIAAPEPVPPPPPKAEAPVQAVVAVAPVAEAAAPLSPPLDIAASLSVADGDRSLVSPPIRALSTNMLADLAGAIHARGFVLGNVSMTLEDLIRDLMRPHLKEWLDRNLPSIVERMVRAEIERLAREAESRKDLI